MSQPDVDTTTGLTIDQVAEATAASTEELLQWRTLALIGAPDGRYRPVDIERVRLIQFVQRRGLGPDAIVRASRNQGDMLGHYVEMITADRVRGGRPLRDAAGVTGLDPAVQDRLWAASGLGDQDEAYDEDIEALGWLRTALDAGLPEDALAQIVRVFADCLGRVAEAEARLFHYYVHDRLRGDGLTGTALHDATESVSQPLEKLIEPALLYFHRKAYQRALREDLLLHLVEDTTPPGEVVGEMQATIVFVDLSGFTVLTEAMGDAAAARLMERFSDLVRHAARSHGRVVKQIGDEFMLAFSEPSAALACGLDIDEVASAEPQFPALRLGAHTGTVLYREGDYVGATVNIAARVTAQADRHQFLITSALRTHADDVPGLDTHPIGVRNLKGVSGAVELFEVRRSTTRPPRTVDPVCLMELDPTTVTSRLTRHGTEFHFCSDECLERFVAAPDQYQPPG